MFLQSNTIALIANSQSRRKVRFLGKTEDGKTDTVGSVRTYRDSHTQSSPMETTSQSVNNAMNRTYAKQAQLQELTKK